MLSEVPEDWSESKLEDVCEILDKFRVPLNSDERQVRKGSVPYWGANGIVDYIDEAIFDEPLLLMPEDGGPFGEARVKPICHKIDEPVWVNNHAHVLRVTGANREYVYQWFVNRDITDFLVGGTRAKLNQKALRTLPVFLPPLNEQHRIAEILSSVDASIQATQAVIEQAERVKRGLMEELLTGGLGSEAIERGELPKGWITKTLTEIAKVATGKHDANHATEGGRYRFYTCAADFFACNTKRFSGGCIILPGNGANVGEVYYYDGEFDAYQRTYVVSEIDVNKRFLLHHLKKYWRERNVNKQYGSATNFLKMGNFKTYKVCLPPQSEQERIAEILSSIDEFIASQKLVVEQQSRAKRGLMDDLLTGKVRTV